MRVFFLVAGIAGEVLRVRQNQASRLVNGIPEGAANSLTAENKAMDMAVFQGKGGGVWGQWVATSTSCCESGLLPNLQFQMAGQARSR